MTETAVAPVLETLDMLMERLGWTRKFAYGYADQWPGGHWDSYGGRLRLHASADVRSGEARYLLVRKSAHNPQADEWRADFTARVLDLEPPHDVVRAAQASADRAGEEDPGRVLGRLTTAESARPWGLLCAPEPGCVSYGAVSPAGVRVVRLDDSIVDPGQWIVTARDREAAVLSSGTPWPVVEALARVVDRVQARTVVNS